MIKLLIFNFCYPEGNFGGNQLLNGSISLSPLNACLTIDLHVRTATNFHQGFPWLHSTHIKFTIFRVSLHILLLSSLPTAIEPVSVAFIVMICTKWQKSHFKHCRECSLLSLRARLFIQPNSCTCSELLRPCFKTGRITRHSKLL